MDAHESNSDQPQAPPANQPPVMDVVAPPPPDKPDPVSNENDHDKKSEQHVVTKAKAPTTAKANESTPGVGFAIFATVVIVLGLAALATYAYLQTAK